MLTFPVRSDAVVVIHVNKAILCCVLWSGGAQKHVECAQTTNFAVRMSSTSLVLKLCWCSLVTGCNTISRMCRGVLIPV